MKQLEEELDLRMKVEIHEIEERKNDHINELMQNHELAFKEMKQYFNDITRENLELIKQHREKYAELQKQTATNENLLHTMRDQTAALKPKLEKQQDRMKELQKATSTYVKDKMARKNVLGRLKDLN